MKTATYFIVYSFGAPVYQTTDELTAYAYTSTYKTAIVKQSDKPIL